MAQATQVEWDTLVDRRNYDSSNTPYEIERRQFANDHESLAPEAKELAHAIDSYNLHHRRRFITYEEMLAVIQSLGYRK